MKKLIILIAILACGVGEVKAGDWYVSGNPAILNSSSEWGTQLENKMHETSTAGVYALIVESKSVTQDTNYDFKITDGTLWYPEGADDKSNYKITFKATATYTLVYYFNSSDHSIRVIATPMLRWNLGNSGNGNWEWYYEEASLLAKVDDFTWSYELTPSKFGSQTSASFRLYSSIFGKMASPSSVNEPITIGSGDVSSTSFDDNYTNNNCWKIDKPSYDFSKIIIKATYNPYANSDFGQWSVSADAYVSPTLSYEVATYSVAAPLDFSQATGVKGYYASAGDASKVTFTKIDGTCAVNTGLLLLRDGTNPISIPVAASGTDYTSSNKLMAGTGASVNSDGSTNRYVLARNNTTGDIHFARLGSSKEVAVGKAYLELPASVVPAPSLSIFFDDAAGGTTAIDAVKSAEPAVTDGAYYNLAGQRVTNPTKGLYIVNGRKVVVK